MHALRSVAVPARFALQPLAAACLLLAGLSAQAQITTSGAVNTYPGNVVLGPGSTDVGSNTIGVGQGAFGSLDVAGGAVLRGAQLSVANNQTGNGIVTLRNAGSRIELTGDGDHNRFEVGNWGVGTTTVSGGAFLDARANAANCMSGARWCNNFIGNGAGSDGTLTVTGAGSRADFLRAFVVGGLAVFRPPIENFTFGTPGGTTQGRVNVLDGGQIRTESTSWGVAPGGSSPTGRERSFADIAISGTGSTWTVQGGSLEDRAAFLSTATHANAWATVNIDNGGKLRFEGAPTFYNGLNMSNGGRTDFTVSGAGSAIEFATAGSVMQVGRSNGTANLQVLNGATVDGLWYLSVGRDGSQGQMTVDGAGSKLSLARTGPAGSPDAGAGGGADIGRNGTGTLTVSNGGRIEIVNEGTMQRGAFLNLGREASSSGTLNIRGAGSVVSLSATSAVPDGGPLEVTNPIVNVGREGGGRLEISGGGKLLLQGGAVSTVADPRSTVVNIGGNSDTVGGARGLALITGAGSELRLSGSDAFIGVGRGAGSSGQLTIANQGLVAASIVNVGRGNGAVGVLTMDNGRLQLSGQQTGNHLSGAGLGIGTGDGTGVANIGNGSRIDIVNMGSAGAGVTIGGSRVFAMGDGSMILSGGSQINVIAASQSANFVVGRDGTGFLRMKDASRIDVGDGSFYTGLLAGSDGTVIVTGGSSISAGFVGIGRNKTGDGGTGTMVVNNSTLTAQTIEIGANGYLGGNGTIIGNVTNYGIFNPGNSPGTFVIDGSFTNGAGGRLFVEVESDGHGGFNTDKFVFKDGSNIDLSGAQVVFRFLGNTDPNAFQASGNFDIDSFFRMAGPNGEHDLSHDLFGNVDFVARADAYTIEDFSFTTEGGATFKATPAVPEPETWALMLAGLGVGLTLARRRRA